MPLKDKMELQRNFQLAADSRLHSQIPGDPSTLLPALTGHLAGESGGAQCRLSPSPPVIQNLSCTCARDLQSKLRLSLVRVLGTGATTCSKWDLAAL